MFWRFPAFWWPAPSRCVFLLVALAPWSQPAVGPPGLSAQPRVRPAAYGAFRVSAFGSPPELVRLQRATGVGGGVWASTSLIPRLRCRLSSWMGPVHTASRAAAHRRGGGRGLPAEPAARVAAPPPASSHPAGLRRRPRTCMAHVFPGRLLPAWEPPLGNGCSRRTNRCVDFHFSLLLGERPRPTTQGWVKVWETSCPLITPPSKRP